MKKNLKKIYAQLIVLVFGFLTLVSPAFATESIFDRMLKPAKRAIDAAYGGDKEVKIVGDPFLGGVFAVINTLLTFTGIIFFLLLKPFPLPRGWGKYFPPRGLRVPLSFYLVAYFLYQIINTAFKLMKLVFLQ